MSQYRICTRCVMDTSDPEISFDEHGRCNHCTNALARLKHSYLPNEQGKKQLEEMIQLIKNSGRGKPYDCLIGISGGVDSSWLTYKSKDWGLRPLIFHVDAGWNTEAAEHNIKALVDKLGYHLHIHTVDRDEMNDLQRAYLQSGLANQDVPQDHIFFAVLFKKAYEMGIKFWLSGENLISESILPKAWGYSALDSCQLKAIHKRFGTIPLKAYETISFIDYCRFYGNLPFFSAVRSLAPLNLMPYNTTEAKEILTREVGWRAYGRKHAESVLTRFLQNWYLPQKFGYDKRKAHLSSLIVSGEMTRDEALEALQEPLYDENSFNEDKAILLDKLGYSEDDWQRIMTLPTKAYTDYPNWQGAMEVGRKVKAILRKLSLAG